MQEMFFSLFFISAKLAKEYKSLILDLQTLQLSAARATVQPSAAPVAPEESIAPLRKTIPPVTGLLLIFLHIFLKRFHKRLAFWQIAGRFPSGSASRQQSGATGRFQGGNATPRDKKTSLSKKKEALLKYEL